MQHTNPGGTWTEWLEEDNGSDDAVKLAALREFIMHTARDQHLRGEITAEWANKKLAALGVTDRIGTSNAYVLEVPVSGTLKIAVSAGSREAARTEFLRRVDTAKMVTISDYVATGHPVFTDGPEDVDPNAVDPDAPTTVGATLERLREVIMLGNIAGPRWGCDSGANRVLAEYDLAMLPERREFAVHRPVEGVMVTVVEAYDEASAARVAGWRWDNSRTGYTLASADPTDEATVTASDNVAV
jgi:hypothetical protein